MELSELMRGAQEAMDRGEYQVATNACTHALEAYPSCITAHRVLGEAHLERGQADLATQHFDRTLEIDPLNVVARLGLGVASEERQDPSTAYMHYLNAWETNPALEQVRDELLRLRLSLGREDRLHPTRAGLASIYARGGQLGRAASEWRALLNADPENVRSRSALAEVLWRSGDDAGAAAAAQEALQLAPQNARLLAILADIERRRGNTNAAELVVRYHEADPLGDVVAGLAELRPATDFDFLRPGPLPVEQFDFSSVQAKFAEPATLAPGALSSLPAPDLWDNLIRDFSGDPSTVGGEPVGDVVPFAWTEETAPAPVQTAESTILGDSVWPAGSTEAAEIATMSQAVAQAGERHETNELNQIFAAQAAPELPVATADASAVDPIAEMAFDLNISAAVEAPADMAPAFSVTEIDDLSALMADASPTPPPVVAADEFDFAAALNDMNASAPDLAASPPVDTMVDMQMAAPEPQAPPEHNQFITADGRVDLTVGWDELDQTLAEATPTGDVAAEYQHLLAEIDAGGIAPFAAVEPAGDIEAWEPFTDDDVIPTAAPAPVTEAVMPQSPAAPDFDFAIDAGWAGELDAQLDASDAVSSFYDEEVIVPAEVAASLPMPGPSGYTEIFRNLDQDSLEDFSGQDAVVNPLASPDISGEPPDLADVLAAEATTVSDLPLDLDNVAIDSMSVDQWLAGASAEAVVPEPVAAAVSASAGGQEGFDSLLSDFTDIEPFAFDDGGSSGLDVDEVDFSEVNEAPFDPAQYSGVPDLAALHDPTRPAMVQPATEDIALDAMFDDVEFALDALAEMPETPLEVSAELEDIANAEPEIEPADVVEPPRSWPAFVGMTSELMDHRSRGGLFDRLRAEKDALVEAGIVTVEAGLALRAEPVATPALTMSQPVAAVASKSPGLSIVAANNQPDHGLDLAMLRDRLLESEAAAREVAEQLETAVSRGTSDAALMRALGEAYLKLGMSEQAAAQFRRAMLARRRAQ